MTKKHPYADLIPCFIEDAHLLSSQAKQKLRALLGGSGVETLDSAIIAVHALKGAAGLFRQREIHQITLDLEILLEVAKSVRSSNPSDEAEIYSFVLASFDWVEQLTRGLEEGNDGIGSKVFKSYKNTVNKKYRDYLQSFVHKADSVEHGTEEADVMDNKATRQEFLQAVDQEVLDCFREEAQGIFDLMDSFAVRLEESLDDRNAVEGLAKAFHQLKGASGMVGLLHLQTVAKAEQNRLELMVESGEQFTTELLAGIQKLLDRMRVEIFEPQDNSPVAVAPTDEVDEEILRLFVEEAGSYLDRAEKMIPSLRDRPSEDTVAKLAKLFHTIKGSAGMVGLETVSVIAKETDNYLESLIETGGWKTADLATYTGSQLERIRGATLLRVASQQQIIQEKSEPVTQSDSSEDFEFFTVDALENLEMITKRVLELERSPHDRGMLEDIFRCVHTIKGASTLVGLQTMGQVCSSIEDMLASILEGKLNVPPGELSDVLLASVDTLGAFLQACKTDPREQSSKEMLLRIGGLESRLENVGKLIDVGTEATSLFEESVADTQVGEQASPRKTALSPSRSLEPTSSKAPQHAPEMASGEEAARKQVIRVASHRLNKLINLVSELIASRTRLSSRIDKLSGIREGLNASKERLLHLVKDFQLKYEFNGIATPRDNRLGMRKSWQDDALGQFSDLEFDRYDDFNILSRGLMEITSDVAEVMNQLNHFFDEVSEESSYFAKVTSNMQHEVTQIRMVPASTLFQRLTRTVRDAAKQESKKVRVVCTGDDTELDKAIIDDLFDPFVHLVRNAVSHGIESTEERTAKSKPAEGTLLLKASQEGNNVVLEVQDDGMGIDFEAVKRRGREMGLLQSDVEPSREELLSLIFRPGFSTRSTVTAVSGRGVGMDAVANSIRKLSGTVSIQTAEGTGTKVTVRLPLTLAINQALMVQAQGETYAIPLNYVEEAILLPLSEICSVSGAEVIRIRGSVIPLLHLSNIFHLESDQGGASPTSTTKAAVILRIDDRRVALLVDRILARQEIVVKSTGNFLKNLGYISGGTIRGDGRVCFIVDIPAVIGTREIVTQNAPPEQRATSGAKDAGTASKLQAHRGISRRKGTWVLIVDDSVSVRKVASRQLENAGYQVDLAVDGLNAMELVHENVYDAIVTDLEMPRMHGFELISELRRHDATKDLPIIVITSRTGEKHVVRAMELGADDCLGKPFTQEDLIARLRAAIEKRRVGSSEGSSMKQGQLS